MTRFATFEAWPLVHWDNRLGAICESVLPTAVNTDRIALALALALRLLTLAFSFCLPGKECFIVELICGLFVVARGDNIGCPERRIVTLPEQRDSSGNPGGKPESRNRRYSALTSAWK